jgi:arginine deiminase
MWARRAKEEHDVFAETLRDRGVTVHYFGQLLAEALDLPAGREFVLDRVCTPEFLGPALVAPFRRLAEDLDGPSLAEYLVGGVLKADLRPLRARSLKWDMLQADSPSAWPAPISSTPTSGCPWASPPVSGTGESTSSSATR